MTCYLRFVPTAEVKKVHGGKPALGDVVPFKAHRTTLQMFLDENAERYGKDLYLISSGPGDAAWLVGVLREPTPYNGAEVWKTATPNVAPVVDITELLGKLRLQHGEGVFGFGRKGLASALSYPVLLTPADRRLLEKAIAAATPRAPGPSKPSKPNARRAPGQRGKRLVK